MTHWLKMIGTADGHWPEDRRYDLDRIYFRGRKPSGVHRGDRMVLYGVGCDKRIFALVEVTSEYHTSDNEEWPYCVDIVLPIEVNMAPRDGVHIDEVSEHLKFSLLRRSHIRLTSEEYERAAVKLREALNSHSI